VREDPEDEENLNTVGGEWAPTEGGVSAAFAGDMMSEVRSFPPSFAHRTPHTNAMQFA
jgi:hypothetical protein